MSLGQTFGVKQVIVYFMIEPESAQIRTNKEKLSTKHCVMDTIP